MKSYFWGRLFVKVAFAIAIICIIIGLLICGGKFFNNYGSYKQTKRVFTRDRKEKAVELHRREAELLDEYEYLTELVSTGLPEEIVAVRFKSDGSYERAQISGKILEEGLFSSSDELKLQHSFVTELTGSKQVQRSLLALSDLEMNVEKIKSTLLKRWADESNLRDSIPLELIKVSQVSYEEPQQEDKEPSRDGIYEDSQHAKQICNEIDKLMLSSIKGIKLKKGSNQPIPKETVNAFNRAWIWLYYVRFHLIGDHSISPLTRPVKRTSTVQKVVDGFAKFDKLMMELARDWKIDYQISSLESNYESYLDFLATEQQLNRDFMIQMVRLLAELLLFAFFSLCIVTLGDFLKATFDNAQSSKCMADSKA